MKPYLIVSQQVPEFVRAEYPAFLEFLKAYYTWLEDEYSIGKLENLVDLDDTIDEFLIYFRKALDLYNITANNNDRFYIRNIKELYTSKGSFQGFEFLFKILYDAQSSIDIPWDYTFRPSEAQWIQDVSFLVDLEPLEGYTLEETAYLLKGKRITIYDDVRPIPNEYLSYVINVYVRSTGIVELFVDRFTPKSHLDRFETVPGVLTGDPDEDQINGTILSTTSNVKVTRAGTGFSEGLSYNIPSPNGGDPAIIRIKEVGPAGSIKGIQVAQFGTKFDDGYTAQISPPTSSGINGSYIFDPEIIGEAYPDNTTSDPDPDTISVTAKTADSTRLSTDLAVVTADRTELGFHPFETGDAVVYSNGGGDATDIGGLVHNAIYYIIDVDEFTVKLATTYSNAINNVWIDLVDEIAPTGDLPVALGSVHALYLLDYAVLEFTSNGLAISAGYYKNDNNILDRRMFIEDSYYYQVYSYVTLVEKRLVDYGQILKKVLHPAGSKHFGVYEIFNTKAYEIDIDTTITNIDFPEAILENTWQDSVLLLENITYSLNKYDGDEITLSYSGYAALDGYVLPNFWINGYAENEYAIED